MTKNKLKAAVWDDKPAVQKATQDRVESSSGGRANCDPYSGKEIASVVEALARYKEGKATQADAKSIGRLDELDILFIDFELESLKQFHWLTADDLVGIIRAETDCKVIVVLNRDVTIDFDLTLTADRNSAADLNLNNPALRYSSLWSPPAPNSVSVDAEYFRPWYWPNMDRAVKSAVQRRSELSKVKLAEETILDFFEFTPAARERLSRTALAALNPTNKDPEKATFLHFVENAAISLTRKELQTLVKDFRASGDANARKKIIRIAASELSFWLERHVFQSQEILVDAAHLLQRMPWLLAGDAEKAATWNQAVANAIPKKIFRTSLSNYEFKKSAWISRPAYWWHLIQDDQKVAKLASVYELPKETFRLQEDFSRFAPESECESFTADFQSVWDKRYIAKRALSQRKFKYGPKIRLLS